MNHLTSQQRLYYWCGAALLGVRMLGGCGGQTSTIGQGENSQAGGAGAGMAGNSAGQGGFASSTVAGDAGNAGIAASGGNEAWSHCQEIHTCPDDLPGSPMVLVPCENGRAFCIDAFETTRAEYEAFLKEQGSSSALTPGQCAGNTSHSPDAACDAGEHVTREPNHPQVCVNWCDAHAYCAWAGKRLCQADINDPTSAALNEWYTACSAAGSRKFPYGNDFDSARCNGFGSASEPPTTVAVGSLPGCEGGYPGLFDMSGNVDEWVNLCYADPDGHVFCGVSSGYWYDEFDDELACADIGPYQALKANPGIGIRCCLLTFRFSHPNRRNLLCCDVFWPALVCSYYHTVEGVSSSLSSVRRDAPPPYRLESKNGVIA